MEDDSEQQMHQLMLERQQLLEEALERAEAGRATNEDWAIIRYECGMPRKVSVSMETISISRSE
jgi:hypothetical protein